MKKNRFIPYGYTMRNGRTVIDHGEAEVIRKIFEHYIEGASLKEIAEELTEQQIPYTEKTAVWDKARISRIIDNAKYIGDGEYDPIIDENTFETAVNAKAARQRRQSQQECEGIRVLRNRVKCGKCGSQMVRRVNSKLQIKESWACNNENCGFRVRISDTEFLLKITILMNRAIENADLMLPRKRIRHVDSPAVHSLQMQVDQELNREQANEEYIMAMLGEIASQMYRETQAKQAVAARIARKRVEMMQPQKTFNCDYFADMIAYVTLHEDGIVVLHTKTDTEISEGDCYGSNEDIEETDYSG